MAIRSLVPILLMLPLCSLQAQMYFDQGRQISGTDSVAFANSNALAVNPAYLGHSRKLPLDFRFLQFGFNSHSDALNRYYVNRLTFSDGNIDEEQKDEIQAFTPVNFDFDTRVSMEWLGMSYNNPTFGGLSVDLYEEVNGTLFLDRALTQLFLEGLDADWLQGQQDSIVSLPVSTRGSQMFYQHLRTLQMGYGRKLVAVDGLEIYGGMEVSRVWGIGYLDVAFQGTVFEGVSAFSRFYDINYGDLSAFGENLKTKVLSSAASGWSTSFGFSVNAFEGWNVGIALLDIGELNWDFRTSSAESNTVQIESNIEEGIESFDFELEADYLYDVFGFSPSDGFTTTFDTRWRFNILGRLTDDLSVSADIVLPTKDKRYTSKQSMILALNYAPSFYGIAGIYINAGALYHENYGWRMPFGLAGQLFNRSQISISTNDLITLFQNKTNPLSSISVATLGLQF